jgi:hypothetical protein
MIQNKGQGTTEYLIILAIVIVIALVVVGVLGGFPSLGAGITQAQSKAYWSSTQPLAIIEWSIPSSGTGSLVFQNQTANVITLTDINWNGTSIGTFSTAIAAGGKATVSDTDMTCGVSGGQPFSRTVGYTYTTPNLPGLKFNGVQPVVGTCQ